MQQTVDIRETIHIYYGTTSGNSSRLAFQFADEAAQHKFIPKIYNCREFNAEQFLCQRLNVFFLSTYGVGGPTGDAIDFNNWLNSKDRKQGDLKDVHFVVFALGNTSHQHFCGMGVKTDAKLEELGATRLFPLGKGNSCNETTDKDYSQWAENGLFDTLEKFSPLRTVPSNQIQSSIYQIQESQGPEQLQSDRLQYSAQRYQESTALKVVEIRELKKIPSRGNSTLYIKLETALQYKAAQNIAIYPENTDQNVEEFCKLLGLDAKQIFDVQTKGNLPFPTPISIQRYLKTYCDFLGPVTKKQLYVLSTLADDKAIQDQLKLVASHKGREQFETEYQQTRECLFTLIKKYNIRNLKLEQLVELCPLIAPRYFTIASSPMKHPKFIEVIASELMITKDRLGLCSEFLRTVKEGQELKCFLQDSSFVYPQSPQVPVLLIGPGAGLAPMRAFIQEKDEYIEQDKLTDCPFKGPMKLFFGCRTQDDYLFKEELEGYAKNGTLNELKVAFSREGQKIRVTSFLDVNFLNDFLELGGVIYVCGSNEMGRDVQIALENMYKQVRKVAPYLAYRKVSDLEQEKILVKELWG